VLILAILAAAWAATFLLVLMLCLAASHGDAAEVEPAPDTPRGFVLTPAAAP
jgi:hypothetical protein